MGGRGAGGRAKKCWVGYVCKQDPPTPTQHLSSICTEGVGVGTAGGGGRWDEGGKKSGVGCSVCGRVVGDYGLGGGRGNSGGSDHPHPQNKQKDRRTGRERLGVEKGRCVCVATGLGGLSIYL